MGATWWTDPTDLDPDQKKVVGLSVDSDHLVIGPPGCGKTNLLLLRATYLYKKGVANISVLAFGRVLREFLATGTEHYPFSGDKIQTYIKWGLTLLRENGVELGENEFSDTREKMLAELELLADKALPQNIFDCILIDEAQDYSAAEIRVIRRFATRLFAVGDSEQQITEKSGALKALEEDGVSVSKLQTHYRNGLKICRVADGIRNRLDRADGLEASSNYDEVGYPSDVRSHAGMAISDQAVIAAKEIATQLLAYPGEMIGVLCPRLEELKAAWAVLSTSKIASKCHWQVGDYSPFSADRPVVIATMHGAKGLEFRALHLLGMDRIKKFQAQKRLSYTGVTRCKTSLNIYHEESLPGYLEKGIVACDLGPKKNPSLDDLFL